MKIDTAVRAVFETEKRRPVRSSIATFLKQHCNRTLTGWRCSKMDADAFLAFASGLGLREGKDYTVVRSSLDPHAIQLKWSADTANRLTQALSEQPAGWLTAVCACAYSLETLPEGTLIDIAVAEEPEEPALAEAETGPFLADLIADKTLHIAQSLKNAEFPAGDEWVTVFPSFPEPDQFDEAQGLREWGSWYADTASDRPCRVPPFAPMPMVEAYVRVCLKESRPGWPETPVFSRCYSCTGTLSAQDVRELYRQVHRNETVPQGNMFLAPLESQFCEDCDSAPLTGYFTRNLEDWRRQNPQDKVGAWVEFNTLIRPTVAAARFMLQPKDAAGYVQDLYRIAYGQDVRVSGYTRTAVHNLFPDVPGTEDITCDRDDEDCNVNLAERIESGTLNPYGLYYMGGLLVTAPGETVQSGTGHDVCWRQRAELPTLDPGEPLDKYALRTDELGKEWFTVVHGALANFAPITGGTSVANLNAFRDMFSRMEANPSCIDTLCSIGPGSHFFTPLGERWTPNSTFMNSLCGILRRYGPRPSLEVVDEATTIIHRIWSGMTTSMSTSSDDQDAFPWVPSIPVVDQLLADRGSPNHAENADKVTDALNRLRAHPECQFRFTERERGSTERRSCVVMVETNVSASKFLDAVLQSGGAADLSKHLKIAFTAPYVLSACCPGLIAASPMDTIASSVAAHIDYSELTAMANALRTADCRDMLKDYVTVSGDGRVRLPRLETFPVDVRVTWDKEDRLVILFSLDGEAAQVLRLVYRCGHKLPLATASYLNSRGKAPEGMFVMDKSLSQASNYVRYLKAQMKFNQFVSSSYATSLSAFVGGTFSPVYDSYALRDFDWDEFPGRGWYDLRNSVTVSALLNAPR